MMAMDDAYDSMGAEDSRLERMKADHDDKVEILRRSGEILVNRWNQLRHAEAAYHQAVSRFRQAMRGGQGGWPFEDDAPCPPYIFEEKLIDIDHDVLTIKQCSLLQPNETQD